MGLLLIEDDITFANGIALLLKSEGFNVYSTGLGEEGIDLGKLYDYDIIVLDLTLPDMNGFVLSQELVRVRPKLKDRILFMSAVLFGQNTVDHLKAMGAGFLSKPFETTSLVQVVNRISGLSPAA